MDIDWQELKHYLQEATAASAVHALTLAVSVAGQQRFLHTDIDGSVSEYPGTLKFGIGCVSRTFIAVQALRLQEKGLLSIDDSVSAYITELADDERFNTITLRHLLQHTAGYGGIGYGEIEGDYAHVGPWLTRIRYAPQVFDPGTVMDLEGSNTLLASKILERVGGQPIGLQLQDCVSHLIANADPLATLPPQNTSASSSDGRQEDAYSSHDILDQIMLLRIGIGDLLTVGEVICGDSSASIFQRGLAALYRSTIRIPRSVSNVIPATVPTGYGLGTCAFANDLLGHDGRADESRMSFRFCPRRKIVIAFGVATDNGEIRNTFLGGILRRLGLASEPVVHHAETFELSELPGRYVGSSMVAINVASETGAVTINFRKADEPNLTLRGEIDSMGHINFPPFARGWNPTFFREPRTGCPCLMMGNNAFKRMVPQPSRVGGKLTVLT